VDPTPQLAVSSISERPDYSARVGPGPPCGGTSPNSPRAGRQQGQVSSSRYAGGPLTGVERTKRASGGQSAERTRLGA
jgi:hypothetical protein